MAVRSALPSHTAGEVRAVLRGLPTATGYTVTVKALRYRSRPHLVAFTFWDSREMLIQVPEPFRPFREMVDLGSRGYPLVPVPPPPPRVTPAGCCSASWAAGPP